MFIWGTSVYLAFTYSYLVHGMLLSTGFAGCWQIFTFLFRSNKVRTCSAPLHISNYVNYHHQDLVKFTTV